MPEDGGPFGSEAAEASGAMSETENEYDDHEPHHKDEDDRMSEQNTTPDGVDAGGEVKKKYDPKDPLRPRRKKARRACYACQRAHLTCGKSFVVLHSLCSCFSLDTRGGRGRRCSSADAVV